MGRLESDEADKALRGKMQAERLDRADWYYKIYNEEGVFVSSTSISKGAKETLRDRRVRDYELCTSVYQSLKKVNDFLLFSLLTVVITCGMLLRDAGCLVSTASVSVLIHVRIR